MLSTLHVHPTAWSILNPSAAAIKANPSLFPSIQLFGYTSTGQTIYVRIPKRSTFVLQFAQELDAEMIQNLTEILNPSSVEISRLDNRILTTRAPELSPIELTANPDFENLATWINVSQDPHGELASLWEARNISPYSWLTINNYAPLPGKYTSCDLNIRAEEESIFNFTSTINTEPKRRLFIWDLEAFSSKPGEFPNSTIAADIIFAISILTVSAEGTFGTVIIKGLPNTKLVADKNVTIRSVGSEKELLETYFSIWRTFHPDRQIYYNGDLFDTPYLLDRLTLNKLELPRISRIISTSPEIGIAAYLTPFGSDVAKTINYPDVDTIDLLHYYRRFFPYLRDHRLDTVAKYVTGQGKTGLSIESMMNAISTNDPDKLAEVVNYSFVDSLRLGQIFKLGKVSEQLEGVCNNLSVDIKLLLTANYDKIIDAVAFSIDPGSVLTGGKTESPSHLKDATKGIYRNIYVYDYSEVYRQIMLASDDWFTRQLGQYLENCPPKLISTAFYSRYVNRTNLISSLQTALNQMIATNNLIAIESTLIRSVGPLLNSDLKLIENLTCYVAVSKASYITLDKLNNIETSGLAKLSRPKFELATDTIKRYLTSLVSNSLNTFSLPNLSEIAQEKFVLTEKITDVADLSENSVKYKLAAQHGETIGTWLVVKYLMIINHGPLLLSKLTSDMTIDGAYYLNELNKYIAELQSLKIYGSV